MSISEPKYCLTAMRHMGWETLARSNDFETIRDVTRAYAREMGRKMGRIRNGDYLSVTNEHTRDEEWHGLTDDEEDEINEAIDDGIEEGRARRAELEGEKTNG